MPEHIYDILREALEWSYNNGPLSTDDYNEAKDYIDTEYWG